MYRILLSILILSLFYFPQNVGAVMTSTNYTIFADDFNSGLVFSSTTYRLEGTAGESPVGDMSSSTYQIVGGYNAMGRTNLTLSISDDSLNLGTLASTQINSASTDIIVTTDENSGYTLSISDVNWTQSSLPDVVGGSVDIGVEEYGFSISGGDVNVALIGQDNVVAAATLMSSTTAVTNSVSTVTFKASIGGSTISGSRSQSITISVSNNL